MNADKTQLDPLTEKVLGAVFDVSNTLGAGFLEKVYQRALLRELGLRGMRATAEASFTVIYKGQSVGEYFADLLVEETLIVELKCAERLADQHIAPMSQLSARLWPNRVPAGQLSEAQSRVAANRAWVCRDATGTALKLTAVPAGKCQPVGTLSAFGQPPIPLAHPSL